MNARTTLADMRRSGELSGYEPTPSRGWSWLVEAEVCAAERCGVCGHEGLVPVDYRSKRGSRRSFAVYPKCEHAEKF